jgi:2-succinyl-5-enolpyruvyl-6-hydroxy-3-cyclohexene-1-carboxylate synthase
MRFSLDEVEYVFFCTGARNQDLLKKFDTKKVFFECDERAASFKALGLSKITNKPVIICTTSGTAVAECVPAMLEAKYSQVALVLISGDRPKKLHGTGSPQTIEHESLTTASRNSFLEIPYQEFDYLSIDKASFPLHLNVLIDDTINHDQKIHFCGEIDSFENFLKDKKSPLFLFSHEEKSMRPFIEKFHTKKIPFYAETLSGARELSIIPTEKDLLALLSTSDCVIRVGHTPLSKIWRILEKKILPVFSFDSRNLTGLSYGEILPWGSRQLLGSDEFWKILDEGSFSQSTPNEEKRLPQLLKQYPNSEISYFKKVHDLLPENALVYLGNSLVVRFFELIQDRTFRVFGNRGVNGIDGQLSTAIGIALGTQETIYCLLGDMTTTYDLASLMDLPPNLKLIIMNNRGGRIFDMLKLDERIIMEHNRDFKDICQGFHLAYSKNLDDLFQNQVLELHPSLEESKEFLSVWGQ